MNILIRRIRNRLRNLLWNCSCTTCYYKERLLLRKLLFFQEAYVYFLQAKIRSHYALWQHSVITRSQHFILLFVYYYFRFKVNEQPLFSVLEVKGVIIIIQLIKQCTISDSSGAFLREGDMTRLLLVLLQRMCHLILNNDNH